MWPVHAFPANRSHDPCVAFHALQEWVACLYVSDTLNADWSWTCVEHVCILCYTPLVSFLWSIKVRFCQLLGECFGIDFPSAVRDFLMSWVFGSLIFMRLNLRCLWSDYRQRPAAEIWYELLRSKVTFYVYSPLHNAHYFRADLLVYRAG